MQEKNRFFFSLMFSVECLGKFIVYSLWAKGERAPQKSADFSGTPQAKGERRE